MLWKRYFFKFKYFIRYNVPEWFWQFLSAKIYNYRSHQYKEKFKSYGSNNKDLVFFVIRRRPPAWGFFSNVFYVAQGLIHAEENGYMPVVDMQNYWVAELSSTKKINDTYNAWCYLFEPVSAYSLEEVYRSKNVVLSNGMSIMGNGHWLVDRSISFITKPELLRKAGALLSDNVINNHHTTSHIDSIKKALNWDPINTLGVFIRGTSYRTYHGSQAQVPTLDYFINSVRNILDQTSLRSLYISTEDYRIYKKLSVEFSDLEIIPSIRYERNLTISEWERQQKLTYDHAILLGYNGTLKYLTEIELLSECTNFVGTPSNASAYALAKSNLSQGFKSVVLGNKQIFLS